MDAITLLKDDHKALKRLFREFEDAGDRAYVTKRRVIDRVIEELSRHAAIEEQLFYPRVRASVEGTDTEILESLEEHRVVKWLLADLESMSAEDERFDAVATVLIENARHHIDEEESDLFPTVRDALGRDELRELGEQMDAARDLAPTHPHPRAPASPPGNLVAGVVAAVTDRVGDTVKGVAQGGANVVRDLVARVRGEDRRAPSPTGSSVARSTAESVRSAADDAADRVEDTLTTATTGASRTVDTARSGAKATANSARRTARRTAATATRS